MLQESCSKLFLIIAMLLFMISINQFGERIFINYVFAAFVPSKPESKPISHPKGYKVTSNIQFFDEAAINVKDFPDDFQFGVSTSAFQIEGGWNADGKSPSTWDTFVHEHPEMIADGSNVDVGSDSYHLFKEDVDAVNHVGFQHYRFSISWTRILPNGSAINQPGIDYYNKVLDELKKRNIEPIVTIYHWDMPQWLQDLGGLTNPLFVDYFKAYADVVFNAFGDKVKRWITINEFYNYCIISYGFGKWAPGIKSPGVGDYLCGHHLLLAHAAAYHLYQEKYFAKQQGQVGVTLESPYYFPKDSSVTPEDHHRALLYRLGWFAQPLFGSQGGYPSVMVEEIAKRSAAEGRPFSRLPTMTDKQKLAIRGTSDFFGINYYTSSYIQINRDEIDVHEAPSWFLDSAIKESVDPTWKRASTLWLYSVPEGLHELLKWIKKEYNNPPVFITETGWSDDGRMEDNDRIDYFSKHLSVVSKAINEDQCNVIAYTAWSLMDSFEWNSGYTIKYGLFHVNFTSPSKERTPKKSVEYLKALIKSRSLPVPRINQ